MVRFHLAPPSVAMTAEVPASDREADLKEGHGPSAEDGEHEEHDDRDHDDDLDDENIFTCDNCQHDFDCLAELTEHRTNHCPA
ncbi:Zinc finger protein 423, partial [Dissostichus eleginoides]